MSGLELNKAAAAILVSGIIAMVTGMAADGLYHGGGEHGGHGEKEAKRGYQVEGAEAAAEGGEAAADAGPVDIAAYLAKADAKAGADVSKKCTSCHDFTKGGPNKVGPELYGVIGRARAHNPGFSYSDGMVAKGGNWDYQSLSEFLTAPAKYIQGTKMSFAGIKKPEERANLLAYLQTLSDSPVPFPKAKAPAADDKQGAKDGAEGKKGAKDVPTDSTKEKEVDAKEKAKETAKDAPAGKPSTEKGKTVDEAKPAGEETGEPAKEKPATGE